MRNILVIDDNNNVRSVVTSALLRSGYSVRQAGNGRAGIQMAINQKPDLIICDINMPELDGYGTLEAIRKCSATAATPFIFMTGSMGPTDVRRGMASGADDYLTKPFSAGELIAAVKSRFARQTDIQTDTFRRSEMRHREDMRQLSKELVAPINGFLSLIAAKLHPNSAARETRNLRHTRQPAYCLD